MPFQKLTPNGVFLLCVTWTSGRQSVRSLSIQEMAGNWDHWPFASRTWGPLSHQFLMHRSIGKVYRTGSVWMFFVSPEQVSARENLVLEKLLCVIAKYCLIQSFVSNLSNLLHCKSQLWRDKCLRWQLWTQKSSTVLSPCHPATWGPTEKRLLWLLCGGWAAPEG